MSAARKVIWRELDLPSTIAPAAARAILVGLAALPNQPRLILEAIARGGRLSWRIGADDDVVVRKATHIVATHLPDTLVGATSDTFADVGDLLVAAQVKVSRSRHLPLADPETSSVTRSLLGALSQVSPTELIRFQLVLGARTWPHRPPQRTDARPADLATRHGQHGFGCAIRIAARSGTEARAKQLVGSVGAALRGLESPEMAITLGRVGTRSVATASSPFLWPLWLSVDDLVPLLAWPTSVDPKAELPGVPPRHPKLLPARSVHPSEGTPFGLATASVARDIRRPIAQAPADALRHRHVLGPTGVGKSNLLAQMALDDIGRGDGVVVIDPKTDLVNDVLARIPADRLDDVVVLDPSGSRPVGLNPISGVAPDLAADAVLAVFKSLFKEAMGPRSSDILHAAVLTLARRGDASLVMVPLLLTNPGFRRSITGHQAKADPLGLGAFWAGYEAMSDQAREQAIRPLLNKLRTVMLRPALRAVFGQRRPAFSIGDVFTAKKIFLVKLGKDSIGPEAAQLLGSLVVSQLWQTALLRTTVPPDQRYPVFVYIDEVQDYLRLPGSLADALAQARGLGMSITAAHQHRNQLGGLLEDIEANTRTKIFFHLSKADARAVAAGDRQLTQDDFDSLPAYHAYAKILAANSNTPWVSLTTEALPAATHTWEDVQTHSEAQYGQALDDIEADLLGLLDRSRSHSANPAGDPTTVGPNVPTSAPDGAEHNPAGRTPALGRRRTGHGQTALQPAPPAVLEHGRTDGTTDRDAEREERK
ncbi:type IV secretory system conjugative DNA transfer family protein [Luteipulveratus mongoliensis]|uniref:type IV secretory system conjugative DNA transfer family protein n=1 Tax=Luteipulveratus mongoliensis TaxID=571913 RepID=UPI000697D8B7|nr:type IV secretion system DNA-binding domain-containing protein [Luteipulveratus mongoliensis]